MKYRHHTFSILHYTLILSLSLLLSSCLVGLSTLLDDENPSPTSTTQSVNLSAEKQQANVSLSGLKAAIDKVDKGGVSWITATPQSYTSGSPSIIIAVTANTSSSSRSATVTITDTKSNKVTLTVSQEGISNKIGDIHNNVTDQPAYKPRRN